MENISKWACQEMATLMDGLLEADEIKPMVDTWLTLSQAEFNKEVSSLLDYSKKEVKKFIQSFIERVAVQKDYDRKVEAAKQK
jgi:hypothetical protein